MAAARRLSTSSWKFAVPASYRREGIFMFDRSRHFTCRRIGLSVDFEHCLGCVEDVGFQYEGYVDVTARNCGSGSHLLPRVTGWPEVSFSNRDGRFVCPRASGIAGDRFNDGARLPGIVFQARGLAAKARKAKTKVEYSESTEDTATTAKANAVKMMETALDVLSREHSKLRTGRALAGMLDHITVEAHGVRTPLNHIAAVTVTGLQTLNVLPYDASMVREVEKAILNSPMGLNPQVAGATMTVPLPRLTKEHCETMCKLANKAGESAKLTIRRLRKEALDTVKSSGDLSKDEMKRFEKQVEELTKKYAKAIDDACKNKEKEIMT